MKDKRIGCAPGFGWISAHLTVQDVERAIQFYEQAFGFRCIDQVASSDQTVIDHAQLQYQDQIIMLGRQGAWGGTTQSPASSQVESPMNLYLYCAGLDGLYKQAIEAGAISVSAPELMFWGDRVCQLKDLDNYLWLFATHQG